ncbi:dTDP-4-dehydrorhamnose 3,5-epimerase family protein [Agrobacterium vaccinii]|uniref:dTDP-4-dehydrorhamnose 3,5-epimerase family protein n=1 Tax=Agrobacterium vaccinii TaxID=2735528 RepID=UPI001E2F07D0|nr:dTDP-4-dehydrorhamnose 3,5-epimerase family protein [Agrobacterium vaccinii]UHS63920.1 dTDP-4-dehydrorhamnose 3,5-epimerase family protein [Agrobacterium vaccinii]
MSRFTRIPTPLTELVVIERQHLGDERGFFSRFFCMEEISDFGVGSIAQINHTMTQAKATIRGMHFQRAPHDEAKFVSCLQGKIFDVAIDLRPASPTYLKWHGEILSKENARSLLIPSGFAHGFQTLTENCELIYLHDKPHAPNAEAGIHPLDPAISVSWPLPVTQMSVRDRTFELL